MLLSGCQCYIIFCVCVVCNFIDNGYICTRISYWSLSTHYYNCPKYFTWWPTLCITMRPGDTTTTLTNPLLHNLVSPAASTALSVKSEWWWNLCCYHTSRDLVKHLDQPSLDYLHTCPTTQYYTRVVYTRVVYTGVVYSIQQSVK